LCYHENGNGSRLKNHYTSGLRWVSAGEDVVIACDTSFLFSLYGNDEHSSKAVAWAAQNTRALLLNHLTHFEFGKALRFSEFRKAIF